MFKIVRNLVFIYFACGSVIAASVDDIVFMTEQYPPYNHSEDNELKGIAVDILSLMMERTQSLLTRDDIKLLPWPRGYKRILSEPNTCLFSTTRTEERESLFKWVGPIAPNTIGLIAKKESNINITINDDLKNYKIGTIRYDIAETHLINAGIEEDSLDRVASTGPNIKKLNLGRIDLWGYGVNVAMWELKAYGLNPEDYELVYTLDDSRELFFAFNKDIPDSVIHELQTALDTIKADGEYQKILDNYLQLNIPRKLNHTPEK
jgi:polar amino acid transport system substrate-binding protein